MESIKENYLFRRAYKKGRKCLSRRLVLYILSNSSGKNSVGITVSTKIGKAVVRNRVKRLIREAYRAYESNIKKGYHLVIVARSPMADSSFAETKGALYALLCEGGLVKE